MRELRSPGIEVACWLSTRQDLHHASLALGGLVGLEQAGWARVRFVRDEPPTWRTRDDLLVAFALVPGGGAPAVEACIDLRDRGDTFFDEALNACGTYFKRDYSEPAVARLPAHLARKVVPFGLNFECRVHGATRRVLTAVAADAIMGERPSAARILRHCAEYLAIPSLAAFEQGPDAHMAPAVHFQTRLWEPEHCYPDDADAINAERVAVVRALKRAFGTRFVGGLLPSPRALRDYPDAVTTRPGRQARYIAESRRCAIGVYTRGLFQSAAFKLAEYLAASKCIVATPLRVTLPGPLLEGEHVLHFTDPEECVERCRALMADADWRRHLQQNAWHYYQEQVAPVATMRRCLEVAQTRAATRRRAS